VKLYHTNNSEYANREYRYLSLLHLEHPGFFVKPYSILQSSQIQVNSEKNTHSSDHPYRDHIAVVLEKGYFNLDTYLETHNIVYGEKIAITSRILDIVESIHKIKLVWMDLKPSNIVLFPTQHDGITVWKGIDVDGSLRVGDIIQNASFVGTLAYMAPELFQSTSVIKASPVLDVWSVGMLVFRLFKNKSFWSCCHIEESDGESLKGYLKTVTNEDMVRIIDSEFHSTEFFKTFSEISFTSESTAKIFY
jgi:serine/threonine protein kinase